MILQIPLILILALAQTPTPLIWAGDEEGGAPYVFRDSKLGRVGFELDIKMSDIKINEGVSEKDFL